PLEEEAVAGADAQRATAEDGLAALAVAVAYVLGVQEELPLARARGGLRRGRRRGRRSARCVCCGADERPRLLPTNRGARELRDAARQRSEGAVPEQNPAERDRERQRRRAPRHQLWTERRYPCEKPCLRDEREERTRAIEVA